MMGGNSFYSNPEAYAFEILQQKLMKEAQRSAQQTIMELSALKSFLGQGQFIYCIPFGGMPLPAAPIPLPFCPINGFHSPEPHCLLPEPQQPTLPSSVPTGPATTTALQSSASCAPQSPQPLPPTPSHRLGHSVVHFNVKNAQSKIVSNKPGSDECNIGKDGIEVTIDLREYLPADICLDVDEKLLEIRANHVDSQGTKTFSRRYDLPACIILESARCVLSHEGFLIFSAAWCKME